MRDHAPRRSTGWSFSAPKREARRQDKRACGFASAASLRGPPWARTRVSPTPVQFSIVKFRRVLGRLYFSESVRRVIQFEHSLRIMRRIEASLRNASALRDRFSKSLASLRHRPNHAKVRSTTHRLGKTWKPLAMSDRLTISVAMPGIAVFCPLAKTGP